jgi:DNA helicase-2/ATP-dependent DNA helicase PcrA
MTSDELLDGLNASQVEAVTARGGPVVVLAGAGSGKTRVLTRRIAWRIAEDQTDPNRVLALTFTRKAAAELRTRLNALGLRDRLAAGTFHAMALLQLRQRWAERNISPPVLVDRKARLVAQLLGRSAKVAVLDVVAEIDWARAKLVGPEHYEAAAAEAGRTPPVPPGQLAELLVRYQQLKQGRRLVDFDDLLMLATRDLQTDRGYAEAVRWRWRHLYVDELQDVNPLQYELLAQWRGQRDDLFVVGDPNQAIYGWNGADPNLLGRFARREPSATVIRLTDNYRSTPQVLRLAASLTTGPALRSNRSDGPAPTISRYPDDHAEAAGVTASIRRAHSVAGSWSDQAVLVRTNAQLVLIDQALAEAGIPTRMRAGAGPLATPEIRTELKLLGRPDADLARAAGDLADRVSAPPSGSVADIERRANLAALARLVTDYLVVDPQPTGPGLVAWLGTLQAGDVDSDGDAVELATFHGSKGLEWSVVHVAGLEDGFVPIAYAATGAQLSEERRLLYVALTRARDELHLSWAAERTFATRPKKRQPSPYLGSLAEAIGRLGVTPAQRVDWRAALARSRQSWAEAAGVTSDHGRAGPRSDAGADREADEVYLALRRWRQRKARAADVPAHVVLSDRTLRAIAAARPATRAGLAAVPGVGAAKLHRYGDDLLVLVGR